MLDRTRVINCASCARLFTKPPSTTTRSRNKPRTLRVHLYLVRRLATCKNFTGYGFEASEPKSTTFRRVTPRTAPASTGFGQRERKREGKRQSYKSHCFEVFEESLTRRCLRRRRSTSAPLTTFCARAAQARCCEFVSFDHCDLHCEPPVASKTPILAETRFTLPSELAS